MNNEYTYFLLSINQIFLKWNNLNNALKIEMVYIEKSKNNADQLLLIRMTLYMRLHYLFGNNHIWTM